LTFPRLFFAVFVVAGIACEPPPVIKVAPTVDTSSTAAEAPPIVIAPAADPTPFHREADVVVKVVPGKVKKTVVPLDGSSAGIFTPDGVGYFVDARTPAFNGGMLVSPTHPDGVKVSVPVHEASFTGDGRLMVVLDDDANEASVVRVTDGTVVGKWSGVYVARFLGNDTLILWQKCHLMRVDLTHPAVAPAPIGTEMCGAADASEDGKTWLIASPSTYPVIVSTRPYHLVQRLDAVTGKASPVASGNDDEPISDVRLSPNGTRVCFRGKGVECLDLLGSTVGAIPKPNGDPFSLRWDLAGEQFLSTAAGDLIWVDLRSRAVRTIGLQQDIREWGFLPDGKHVYAYDKGAWIVDLQTGNTTEIYPKDVTVGVFSPSPKSDRFLVTRVLGDKRQVDLVELEP
jgi:hypothetical protein